MAEPGQKAELEEEVGVVVRELRRLEITGITVSDRPGALVERPRLAEEMAEQVEMVV